MSEEKKGLFNDWSTVKAELLKGLDSKKNDIVKSVFENSDYFTKQLEEREAEKARREALTPEEREAEDIIKKLKGEVEVDPLFPMIRRIIPSTIANDIVGVQPMSKPTDEAGKIYSIRYKFKDIE